MRLDEVIACKSEIGKRKLVGRFVRDEVALQGTVEELAAAANMSSPAMYQVFNAGWSVAKEAEEQQRALTAGGFPIPDLLRPRQPTRSLPRHGVRLW